MAYPEDLRPASFRGIPFGVSATETGGLGRRGQITEYPERDVPFAEDLGRESASFTLEAFVAGDDYLVRRNALIEACGIEGPGQLVHPTFGERRVLCVGCIIRESVTDGGIALLTLSFAEAGDNSFPTSSPFTASLVENSSIAASDSVQATFARVFSLNGVPQWVNTHAGGVLTAAHAAISAAIRAVPKGEGQDLAEITRNLGSLITASTALLGDPTGLASTLSTLISNIGEISAGPLGTIRILEDLARFGDALDPGSDETLSRARAQANQEAMVALVRRQAALEAARAAPDAELASYTDAVALRDRVSNLLDTEITTAADALEDDDAAALRALHLEAVRDLTLRAGQLRVIQGFTPADTIPAVVIAQRLYGDALRADEICARNHVEHPGFVPGGVELEVLSA